MAARRRRRGFTLLEALLALVLATLLIGALSLYTGTWLKQWNRLVMRGSQEDVVAIVLDRIVEDLEETQPIYAKEATGERVMFTGGTDTVTFLRPALGFDARAGLDEVTYLNGRAGAQAAIIRSRRGFDPKRQNGSGEELPLIRGDMRLDFSYADAGGNQASTWNDPRRLPVMIRVEISGATPRRWRQFAYARLRVEMPANCGTTTALPACKARMGQ
jgi:hypothetical protein